MSMIYDRGPENVSSCPPCKYETLTKEELEAEWSGEHHPLGDNSNSSRLAVLVVICRISAFSRSGDRSKNQFPTPLPSLIAQETLKPFIQALLK
jgi:hypothetical protein